MRKKIEKVRFAVGFSFFDFTLTEVVAYFLTNAFEFDSLFCDELAIVRYQFEIL